MSAFDEQLEFVLKPLPDKYACLDCGFDWTTLSSGFPWCGKCRSKNIAPAPRTPGVIVLRLIGWALWSAVTIGLWAARIALLLGGPIGWIAFFIWCCAEQESPPSDG